MYRKITDAIHLLNILFQALYTLVLPIGIGALASHLLTKYTSVGGWIWAVLIITGVMTGLYSMIKFILSATKNLDRLIKNREQNDEDLRRKQEKQERLREDVKNINEEDTDG